MKPHRVTVALGKRSYDILIGADLLKRTGALIAPLLPQKRVVIITDTEVAKRHLKTLQNALTKSNVAHQSIILPSGEKTKSYAQFQKLLEQILKLTIDRKTTLVALGGGVIGDITGFAASVLLRGIPFIQIPTTLLAMVDSSVGGKTGINSAHGKNLIGSFYQPMCVLADTALLKTLPKRELLAGYAEIVKYGLINDSAFFAWLEKHHRDVLSLKPKFIAQAVKISCEAKAGIVTRDEKESGERMLLNLGHTFGHALEAAFGYSGKLLHGEAVAIGMKLAADLSAHLGLCDKTTPERIVKHMKASGLPYKIPTGKKLSASMLLKTMYKDKKAEKGTLVLILLKGIGKAFVARDVRAADIQKIWQQNL